MLFAISPQLPAQSRALEQQRKLGFRILFDEMSGVAASFGLRFALPRYLVDVYRRLGIDLEAANGEPRWRLPIAARYIVDRNRRIRYARVNADYTRRPEPGETVAALRALRRL